MSRVSVSLTASSPVFLYLVFFQVEWFASGLPFEFKSTPEYKIGKEILEGDIDVEPTTADKYNKEWLDEKGSES